MKFSFFLTILLLASALASHCQTRGKLNAKVKPNTPRQFSATKPVAPVVNTMQSPVLPRRTVLVTHSNSVTKTTGNLVQPSSSPIISSMPWIAALVIGLLTIGINIYIAKENAKVATSNMASQLAASKQSITEQIASTQSLANKQFKENINSNNRQKWIDDLRHCTSELVSQCAVISYELGGSTPDNEKIVASFEKLVYNRSKISLLLNADKPEQVALRDAIYDITNHAFSQVGSQGEPLVDNTDHKDEIDPQPSSGSASFPDFEVKVVRAARVVFKKHWDIIKNTNSEAGS